MGAHSFSSFNQDTHGSRGTLAGRLGAQIRIAAIAYPALAVVTFAVATGAALINPSLLKPIPALPVPENLSPVAQSCFEQANRDLAGTKVAQEIRTGLAALIAMGCLDRAYTARAADPPGAPSPR